MPIATATVETLTAEVRVLMVGSRQVTLSVYRQLDRVPIALCEPFGRVADSQDKKALWVVGKHRKTGELVRAHPSRDDLRHWTIDIDGWCAIHQSAIMPSVVQVGRCHIDLDKDDVIRVDDDSLGKTSRPEEWPQKWPWRFASPELRDAAEQQAADIASKVDEQNRIADECARLPLIVLAGLR